jgi:uncharacterized membrane protein YkvA (DUF1232 family)
MTTEHTDTFDAERAAEQFSDYCSQADETLKDHDKTESVIEKALKKLKKTADKSIKIFQEDILLFLDVLKAYISGRYRKIPFKTLAMLLAAVTYFSWPFDLIFDLIPAIGFLDDIFIISMTLKLAHDDLQAYKNWKAVQSEEQSNPETAQPA